MTTRFVQIPRLNEVETLPAVLAGISRDVSGIERVDTLIINIGNRDGTAAARRNGADHFVHNLEEPGAGPINLGTCLSRGTDIVVNMIGDNRCTRGGSSSVSSPTLRRRSSSPCSPPCATAS